jgi:hypothetical protein
VKTKLAMLASDGSKLDLRDDFVHALPFETRVLTIIGNATRLSPARGVANPMLLHAGLVPRGTLAGS